MRTLRPHRYLTAAAFLFRLAGVASGRISGPSARQVIAEMVAGYKRLSSYQDTGVLRLVPGDPRHLAGACVFLLRDASWRDETLVSFKTFYARPGDVDLTR